MFVAAALKNEQSTGAIPPEPSGLETADVSFFPSGEYDTGTGSFEKRGKG